MNLAFIDVQLELETILSVGAMPFNESLFQSVAKSISLSSSFCLLSIIIIIRATEIHIQIRHNQIKFDNFV